MAIDTNEILELLRKCDPNLNAPVIKIEFQGVVDNLEVKSIYLVPASEGYPFALHIEVDRTEGSSLLITLDEAKAAMAREAGLHRAADYPGQGGTLSDADPLVDDINFVARDKIDSDLLNREEMNLRVELDEYPKYPGDQPYRF